MWYEILPCLGIITTALTLPSIFTYYTQKFTQNGNVSVFSYKMLLSNKLFCVYCLLII